MKSTEYLQGGQQVFEPDAVEHALAAAIRQATSAGKWELIAQLAKELEARRLARKAPDVVSLNARRRSRKP